MLSIPKFASTVGLTLVLAACSKPADRVEVTEKSTRSETRPVPQVNVPSAERFAEALPKKNAAPAMSAANAAAPAAPSQGASLFDYETPAGWTLAAPSQFRDVNFTIGPNAEIECYVSVLQGKGGGMLVNLNRWRQQLGQAPIAEEDFSKLPRASILGRDATIADFTGSFLAMGEKEPKPGYRLVGALIEAPMAAIFIKMIGPDALVEAQKDNFARFAQSLKMKAAQAPAAAPSMPSAAAPAAGAANAAPTAAASAIPLAPAAAPAAYTWKMPEGWQESPAASPMRTVTFRFGANGEGECYVASLPGQAGGRIENFNRWLAQMGQSPLKDTELELQPPVFMFEEEVPMLIAKGTYGGMGGETHPGYALFGALAEVDGQSVFVKLIAPEALANDNMQKFAAFCGSLRKKK